MSLSVLVLTLHASDGGREQIVLGAHAVQIVRFVRRTQKLGFSLEEINTLLELSAGGPASLDAASELASAKVAELDQKLASIT